MPGRSWPRGTGHAPSTHDCGEGRVFSQIAPRDRCVPAGVPAGNRGRNLRDRVGPFAVREDGRHDTGGAPRALSAGSTHASGRGRATRGDSWAPGPHTGSRAMAATRRAAGLKPGSPTAMKRRWGFRSAAGVGTAALAGGGASVQWGADFWTETVVPAVVALSGEYGWGIVCLPLLVAAFALGRVSCRARRGTARTRRARPSRSSARSGRPVRSEVRGPACGRLPKRAKGAQR